MMIRICSPLEQFVVFSPAVFSNLHIVSNTSWYTILIYVLIAIGLYNSRGVTQVGFIQFIMVFLFKLVTEVAESNLKIKKQIYLLHLYIMFLFILIANIIGLFPYSLSLTSHFSVSFFISYSFYIASFIIGIKKNGWKIFYLLLPIKVPLVIAPLLIAVEVISIIIRPLSLSVRLSANMLAGHILLKILASVAWYLLSSGSFISLFFLPIPLLILFFVMLLELMIAFLQAYVFLVLMTIYLNDVINV